MDDCFAKVHVNGYPIPSQEKAKKFALKKPLASEQSRKPYACRRCGRQGHEEFQCYATVHNNGFYLGNHQNSKQKAAPRQQNNKCSRCGREGHFKAECYAKYTVDGSPLPVSFVEEIWSQSYDESDDSGDNICFRCGRKGHWATNCYAKSSVNGKPL